MDISTAFLVCVSSYLAGSISFSRLVARILNPSIILDETYIVNADGSEGSQLLTVGATTALH